MSEYCPKCAEPSVESKREDAERVRYVCPNGHEWTVIDDAE